jgi:hypothetical protein
MTGSVIHVISSERKRVPLVPRFRTYRFGAISVAKGPLLTYCRFAANVHTGQFRRAGRAPRI